MTILENKSNYCVLEGRNIHGCYRVLFSYVTPVALWFNPTEGQHYLIFKIKPQSRTTGRHQSRFLDEYYPLLPVRTIDPQSLVAILEWRDPLDV